MRFIVALVLALVYVAMSGCKESDLDSFHSQWQRLPVSPAMGSNLLRQANASPCTWKVLENVDRVAIARVSIETTRPPDQIRAEFAGGTFVGENNGEWTGSLWALEGTGRKPRKILSKNVLQMFLMRDGVAVFTGDLTSNEGSIWMYSKGEENVWSMDKKADLHGYPRAIGKRGDRVLLVYGDAVSVMEGFREHLIVALPLLEVRPNSIVQDKKGNIYVGANAFVVRLISQPDGYSQQWFTQRECLQ